MKKENERKLCDSAEDDTKCYTLLLECAYVRRYKFRAHILFLSFHILYSI